jgi:hypothetical protein
MPDNRIGEFVVGKCTGHDFGSGYEAVKDYVNYDIVCNNPRCWQKFKPAEDMKTARFRAQFHSRENKNHPTLVKMTEVYRDGHQHETFTDPYDTEESPNALQYKAPAGEQKAVRENIGDPDAQRENMVKPRRGKK